ncbi:hypothetical protein DTO280E4_3020 [Paecilomyces variotii]|nr:hypothetical protein DTO169E5_2428 [Paecilomyces variotii]KAJ9260632.1 hypothetical protein DTO195F2_4472 [Paecilomyces variotii]KAJ9362985.1 hypothetical protein DTO280E4_3020 [Paecilomyces variotii]
MRRFERIYDVVEPVEEYRRGGYHPVHLHDIFNQRYEVTGKLAFGQYSTVWLANDQWATRHVALKILKADASENNNRELSILSQLSITELDHPGKAHIVELLDHFEHIGPNGTHSCLVFPVMISDGKEMTLTGARHRTDYVRNVTKQILLGLDFLHKSHIIHCDLQPANIMFTPAGVMPNEMFLQPPEFSPVKWLEGTKADNSAPNYLVSSQRRRGQLDNIDISTISVKIGDLGGATWDQQCDQWPVIPTALRSPELIHRNPWDANVDIWALGCVIFELATNEPLFPLGTLGLSAEQIDKEHDFLIGQILGNNGQGVGRFTEYLMDRLPGFDTKDAQHFASFLLLMLQVNPGWRVSASKLLNHIFLVGGLES